MKYTIKIPKPCNENWVKWLQHKEVCFVQIVEVINYQYYSDNQLLKSLNESEKICGRFSPNQIDKEISSLETNRFHQLELLLGFSLFFYQHLFIHKMKSQKQKYW
jgi:hypothetical protein